MLQIFKLFDGHPTALIASQNNSNLFLIFNLVTKLKTFVDAEQVLLTHKTDNFKSSPSKYFNFETDD